jgi:hypothetical protein
VAQRDGFSFCAFFDSRRCLIEKMRGKKFVTNLQDLAESNGRG